MTVLVVSDIHANIHALQRVLDTDESCDAIWNLGDTVGYGAKPNECMDLMERRGSSPWLAGNHDLAAVGDLSTEWFNPLAAEAAKWTARHLDRHHRDAILSMPSMTTGDGYTLAHGSPRSPVDEYIVSQESAAASFSYFETQVCFVGHSHIPFVASQGTMSGRVDIVRPELDTEYNLSGSRAIVNPGSVGQPRDRDSRAAYALFSPESCTVVFKRIRYDIPAAQAAIRQSGLPERLAERLAYGI